MLDVRSLPEPERAPVTAAYLAALLAVYAAEPLAGEAFVALLDLGAGDPLAALPGLPVAGRCACPRRASARRALVLVGPNAVGEAARRLLRLHAGRVPIVPLAGGDIDRAALAAQREHFGSPERDFVNLEPALDLDRLEVVMAITDYRGGIRAATDLPTDQVNPGRQVDRSFTRWIDRGWTSGRPRETVPPAVAALIIVAVDVWRPQRRSGRSAAAR